MLIDWLEQRLEYTQRKRLRKLISNLTEIVYVNALFALIMLIMLSPFIILFISGDHPSSTDWQLLCTARRVPVTQLYLINKHHISLFCQCGHDSAFSVQELLKRLRPDTTVNQVADKARCTVCGRKGNKEFRLYWKCG